jgi:hypothetical protein
MRTVTLLLAVALSRIALAAVGGQIEEGKVAEKPVLADTPDSFAQQQNWIENEMRTGGRYEYARPADKQRVKVLLDQMASLLQRAGSVAAMDHATRIDLFNEQEEVNGLLKHNDANRLVCESRAPVGSHIPITHCHTFRQIEETARNTRRGMQEFDHSTLCNGANVENPCAPGSHQKIGGH